ncbi:triacylglycerol lipase [Rhodococcus wratislaviensis]|uniref:Triacylglycerol lipase n=1 Tax=Rhodococcus wratislaviensis TaxID=44752 RepID=A0A402CKB8_RHOWR|nr:triacylglycerol lipase [Rhodococcus wratislaviensis]
MVAAAAPGEIIAAREVHLANLSVLPVNVDAWQLSYRSNNSRDEAIPAVATVIKPRGTIDGVRNLPSLQPAEDSLGQYCAASYALQQWSVPAPLTGQVVAPLQFLEARPRSPRDGPSYCRTTRARTPPTRPGPSRAASPWTESGRRRTSTPSVCPAGRPRSD